MFGYKKALEVGKIFKASSTLIYLYAENRINAESRKEDRRET